MKVPNDKAIAAFREQLEAAESLEELEAIQSELEAERGNPLVNQFKLQILLSMFYAEVNHRVQEATEVIAALHMAAFETTH